MLPASRHPLAWLAALVGTAAVCLATGCAPTRATSQPAARAAARSPTTPAIDERAQVESLAQFATGVAMEYGHGFEAALPHYQLALAANPSNTTLAVNLAKVFVARKEPAEAVALLEHTTQTNPNVAEVWLWLGVAHRAAEHTPEAIAALRHALKLEPTLMLAIQFLLEIQLHQDDIGEAVKLLDQAWNQKSSDPAYWLGLGDLCTIAAKQKPALAKELDPSRGQRCYEKALALTPDDPKVLRRLADLYDAKNESAKAIVFYTKLLATNPNDTVLRLRLASNYLDADQKEKAAAQLEQVIKREPLRYEVYNSLGEIYDDLKQDDRAISNYQQSLVVNPNQLEPCLRIVLIHLKHKKYAEAHKTLLAAKEKFPTAWQVSYFQALVANDQKQFPQAVALFADAQTLAGEASEPAKLDSSFYFYYGSACERNGEFDKAVQLFRKSIELDPTGHAAYNYLGYMWADKGIHLDEALEMIQKAVARDPDNGAYLDSLGWVLFKLGRDQEALPHLRRAVELIKDDPIVFEHLADVLLRLGKRTEAITELQRAHKADPDNKAITEKLQKLSPPPATKP